jgi:SnoaL-like domain
VSTLLFCLFLSFGEHISIISEEQPIDEELTRTGKEAAMPMHLPKAIEIFMSSENAHDTNVLAECFAADATVRDEGRTVNGLDAIKAWRRETTEKYQHTIEPVAVAKRAGSTVDTSKLKGNFPGSPVTLDFVFRLKGGRIASLGIQS